MTKFLDPVQRVYNWLTDGEQDEARHHRKPALRIRASEAGNCARNIWYRLSGYRPSPSSADNKLVRMQGDIDHDLVRILMVRSGVPIDGIKINPDGSVTELLNFRESVTHDGTTMVLSGRADGVLPETPYGKAVFEFKSKDGYSMDWLQRSLNEGRLWERVERKHWPWVAQCDMMMMFNGLDVAYLLPKNRSFATLGLDTLLTDGVYPGRCGIFIKKDEERMDALLNRLAGIWRAVREGDRPELEIGMVPSCSECRWCNFRYLCHDADKRAKKGQEPAVVYPGPKMEKPLPKGDSNADKVD